jgi:hypothetical protein
MGKELKHRIPQHYFILHIAYKKTEMEEARDKNLSSVQ